MRTLKPTACCLLALSLLTIAAPRAEAWGFPVDRIVARIAAGRIKDSTKQKITALIGSESMSDVATWADVIAQTDSRTKRWHYVDIPVGSGPYSGSRDCASEATGDCVIKAIERSRATLEDSSATYFAKKDALRYLIRCVGDLHQPLHCAERNGDGGGDLTKICWFGSHKDGTKHHQLHKTWDRYIIEKTGLSEDAYVAKLEAKIAGMSGGDIDDIEDGSLEDAKQRGLAAVQVCHPPE
jgi:nuclease S1